MTEPTEPRPSKRTIPPDLQKEADLIQIKVPRNTGPPGDLDEEKKRWLIVGICLHSIISPLLRKYVDPILRNLFSSLVASDFIDTQGYHRYLKKYPSTNRYFLNYESINNNKSVPKKKINNKWINDYQAYDYKVTSHVDLSKLFLRPSMAQYSAIDESCDSSALLGMVINISSFQLAVQFDAEKIRSDIRNPWAQCDFTEWTTTKYTDTFRLMGQLVMDLRLLNREENKILGELNTWATYGQNFLSGTVLNLEIVNHIHQQTQILSEYALTLCTEADSQFIKVQQELNDLKNSIQERMGNLERKYKEYDEILNNLKEEIKKQVGDHIPPHIRAHHGQEIREWEQDRTMFVQTRATHHILESLPLNNCIVVTGSLGCGKSANIHHAALSLRDEFQYEIIPVLTGPTDILNYYIKNKRQVFVVDDICGKRTINRQTLQMWRDYSEKLEKIFKTVKNDKENSDNLKVSDPKLLISCSLHIYKESKFQQIKLLTRKECNLLSSDLCLLQKERMLMLQKYLPSYIIEQVMPVMENVDYFPLLCKLSKNKTSEETIKLFTAPVASISVNIPSIISENSAHFCALVLCVLSNDGFDTDWLKVRSVSETKTSRLEHILKEFDIDLSKEKSINTLKSSFASLEGTYLQKKGTQYRMIHDKIDKMVAEIFVQELPDTLKHIILEKKKFEQHGEIFSLHTEPERHGSIPASILRMDKESIQIYMKALESGSEIKHDIRVIIVGKKGAGKTSLVKNLLKENLDNVKSTNGIDIHVKRCKIRTADGKWFIQEGSLISDISQRMLRSMITQTRVDEYPRTEEKNEYLEEIEEEETANQCEDTIDLNIVHPHLSVEEATANVQSRDTDDLTLLAASVRKQESSDVTDKMQHDIDLREMIDSARDMDDEEYASLSFWDFAGDREFYNTHQTFLSDEAIYLVLTKLNETDDETNETLKFWFDSIHFYGTSDKEKHEDIEQVNRPLPSSKTEIEKAYVGNSSAQIYDLHDIADSKGKPTFPTYLEPPIIAIGTHKDQCLENYKDELLNQIRYNIGDSAARQHLRVCHYISNKTDEDHIFEVLRRDIFEIGKKMPDFGKRLPTRFIQLEKSLNEKLHAGTQFLSLDDVTALAEKIGAITDIAELDVFLRYHHDFGNLIYFKDIPEYIILNPQWLVNVFRLLVTADEFRDKLIGHKEWDEYETTGKLTESLLSCIFANQTDDITTCKEHILKIMEKFDIIVRPRMLVDDKEQVDPHYYVPCMIKTIASKKIQDQLKKPQEKSYCLCLEFNFLPPVFINHFIIACIRKFTTSKFRGHNTSPRLALFRCAGLFNINVCEKLLVASFKNFIQFQIWKFDSGCRTSYKHIGKYILEEVDKIILKNYRLRRINYEVKMKCESTSYDCFDGIISPDDIAIGHDYFCEEHDEMHVYRDDWFSEHKVTKRADEFKQENKIDLKKDGDRFCIEVHVQKNMKKEASSAVEMNMAKMVKVALNILADVLFDLLKLETYKDPRYILRSRSQCDITFLYGEHRHMNKHKPSNSSKRRCAWGGEWTNIAGTDNALGDDIERIRLTRNELQHMKFFALDDTRYTELCTILQDVLNRFDIHINPSHLYTDRLNEILKNTVERDDVECFKLEIKSKL